MEFVSALSEAQIISRLETYTHTDADTAVRESARFESSWDDNGWFSLVYTGGILGLNSLMAFDGRILNRDGVNVIRGEFAQSQKMDSLLKFPRALVLIIPLVLYIKDPTRDIGGLVTSLLSMCILVGLLIFIARAIPGWFQKSQHKEIIEFIETYLLH